MLFRRAVFTLAEVSLVTGICMSLLHKDVASEKLVSRKIAGKRKVLRDDLERYLGHPLSLGEEVRR